MSWRLEVLTISIIRGSACADLVLLDLDTIDHELMCAKLLFFRLVCGLFLFYFVNHARLVRINGNSFRQSDFCWWCALEPLLYKMWHNISRVRNLWDKRMMCIYIHHLRCIVWLMNARSSIMIFTWSLCIVETITSN